ncbi:MAG: hypothetical protein ACJ8FY_21455 [Gemmataceae bacterium]
MWDHDFASPPVPSVSSEVDRRGAERFACDSDLVCRIIEPLKYRSNQVGIRDISRTGICLLLSSQFQTGTELAIELENHRLRFTHRLPIRVQHNGIQLPNESWLHGCAFGKVLPKEVLEVFSE